MHMCKMLATDHKLFKIAPNTQNIPYKETDDVVHLVDLHSESARDLLYKAIKDDSINSPSRWLLFANDIDNHCNISNNDRYNDVNSIANNDHIDHRRGIENQFADLYIDINTEVYVTFRRRICVLLYSVYKIKAHLPLIWEDFGVWTPSGFDRPRPAPAAVRRHDLQGADVVVPTVLLHNETLEDLPDYLHRERDTMTKLAYYMCSHLVEWVNGTKVLNRTTSWGYLQPDGRWDGIVREMQDGRADIAGSCMIAQKERVKHVNYVLAPSKIEAMFVFKKPSLASVTNIYVLPFGIGVWMSTVVLIVLSTATLFLSYFGEDRMNYESKSWLQKMSDGFFDTLCLVFQQGTAADPLSMASRQILLLGLMAFMFLYTAYSANVVALLQSPTNDINNVETLLTSPVACGSQDVVYAWQMFGHESRPIHRLLADRKINSQGKKGYLSVEDGIRKVREGMFAFHVEQTAGFDQIQKTFLEDEKCNLGFIKYMSTTSPFIGFSQTTPIKEMLRIGANRIMEVGVQSRSARRLVPERPRCGASAAMFNTVRLSDVAPAFRLLLSFYALTLPILGLEIFLRRREIKRINCDSKSVDTTTEEITENVI
ncbi:glutamate receptor 3-like [Leguminivora glycinivorella]|uniref:glutamate receptor 3-like n=1 Tax=Leguminivora glycinivorella TaxID=1035111 RepID=UPI002010214F|nr:glutamate receptor 3-like [Leguminivora glycinivorella]